jgi:hypothetical protein
MAERVKHFYDGLARNFHLILQDGDASMRRLACHHVEMQINKMLAGTESGIRIRLKTSNKGLNRARTGTARICKSMKDQLIDLQVIFRPPQRPHREGTVFRTQGSFRQNSMSVNGDFATFRGSEETARRT